MNEKILKLLLKLGILSSGQINEISQKIKPNEDIVFFLIENGYIDEETFLKIIARHFGIETLKELSFTDLDENLINRISIDLILKYKIIPFRLENGILKVLTVNPFNSNNLSTFRFLFKVDKVVPVVVPPSLMESLLSNLEKKDESIVEEIVSQFQDEAVEEEEIETVDWEQALKAAKEEAPIIKLVNAIIYEGVKKGASDIHIEPQEKDVVVRYRIDGVLRVFQRFPKRLKDAIVARIKIMANLDISERRKPQDGRIRLVIERRKIDLRVSTLPTIYGEKIVMRIQEAEKYLQFTLEDLGFEADNLLLFRHHIWQPWGMVLVTGPTGSGKTTTLYTALQERNTPEVNIMTAEDPVEVAIPGINQVQINERIGLTFASVLRAFLRQDPDIILVGEIRDLETAEIAIKAALTGHLVFSTLHTNDAPSTTTRLVDMGVEPFLVGTAVNLIVAQRLIRRLCPKCKLKAKEVYPQEYYQELEKNVKNSIKRVVENLHKRLNKEKNPQMKEKLVNAIKDYQNLYSNLELYTENPEGCEYCNHTGYKGRMAVHELLEITEGIKKLILRGANSEEIKLEAINEGMRTLYEDGLVKVGKGLTSIEEVKRVLIGD